MTNHIILPKEFSKNILTIYKNSGEQWLHDLPALLRQYEEKWQLTLQPCFADACFNYVAPALLKNGDQAVLKCGINHADFTREITALKYFNGIGSVALLQSDINNNMMLMERLMPGTSLEQYTDKKESILYSVDIIKKLHKPLTEPLFFPTLSNWFSGFDKLYQQFHGHTGPFSKQLIEKAVKISHDLLNSSKDSVLLHGDLHESNIILSKDRRYLAIDPKGVIGEPEYEIPMPRLMQAPNKCDLINRLNYFIEASGFDRQRVFGWAFAKTVLAAWWSFEDSGEIHQPFLQCAEILLPLQK